MKTTLMLLAQYDGRAAVPVEDVCRDYFAPLTLPVFLRKLGCGEIPLPVTRMTDSQKGPKMIHIEDLAAYIDRQRESAKRELAAMRS